MTLLLYVVRKLTVFVTQYEKLELHFNILFYLHDCIVQTKHTEQIFAAGRNGRHPL